MKFSIIIPSYGQAKYLRDAIESSLSQVLAQGIDYEVIVVDDGSVDGSLEIAKEYLPRIKLIQQTNKGLASARNAGIMNAQGKWIIPLDADDRLFPKALATLYFFLKDDVDVVGFSLRCVKETGETQDTVLIPEPKFNDFKEGNRLAYCAAIRRSVLHETGGYSPKMDVLGGWEDLHLWYDLMRRGKKIVTIPEPLVMYRVKENSMWKDAQKNAPALWAQIVKDFPEAKEHVKP